MARIMVLGAGRGQTDLIKAVKKYGHTAIVASVPGAYPGFQYADEICYVDVADPMAVEKAVLEKRIQGIAACCMDTPMESLGYICEKYHFRGPSYEAAAMARDKLLMKECLVKAGVRTAAFMKVSGERELALVEKKLTFPVIVKAVDQQGSRGIYIAQSPAELAQAWKATMEETRKDYCIVEEYLIGEKHGVNGCIIDGAYRFVLPSKDITDKNAVLGHIFPFDLEEAVYNDIIEQTKAAVAAMGLDDCVFNVDIILKDDKAYIIELTGRMGANGLPDLLSIYYGVDIYRILVDIAADTVSAETFLPKESPCACCSKMIISQKTGVLKEIINHNPADGHIAGVSYFVSAGDAVSKYRSAKDCVGQIIVRGDSASECEARVKSVEAQIELVLEE